MRLDKLAVSATESLQNAITIAADLDLMQTKATCAQLLNV